MHAKVWFVSRSVFPVFFFPKTGWVGFVAFRNLDLMVLLLCWFCQFPESGRGGFVAFLVFSPCWFCRLPGFERVGFVPFRNMDLMVSFTANDGFR